jgi:hypothetical protein
MKSRLCGTLGAILVIAGCSPRDEFPHETVLAYQANDTMRASILQRCADHITSKRPFKTQADTEECQKALAADQNVRLAQHLAKERAADAAAFGDAAKQFGGK